VCLSSVVVQRQVFLHRGGLHIIPKAKLSTDEDHPPDLSDAVCYVRSNHAVTAASAPVQRAVERRISGYCTHALSVSVLPFLKILLTHGQNYQLASSTHVTSGKGMPHAGSCNTLALHLFQSA